MAGGAEVLALVVAAVEHLVAGVGVGERGPLGRVGADEVLPGAALGVAGRRQVVGVRSSPPLNCRMDSAVVMSSA